MVARADGVRAAPASGKARPFLAWALRDQRTKSEGRLPDVAAERNFSAPRIGGLADAAHGGFERSGDAAVAGPGAKPEGTSKRKFRAGSDGTFYAGRRSLQREGYYGSGAGVHWLVLRSVESGI